MMRSLLACMSVLAVGLALTSMPALQADAQSSCSEWNAVCRQRCGTKCGPCGEKLASCRRTGCWKEVPKFGGATHCNLKKS